MDDNLLAQVIEKPTKKGVLLDLILMNKEELDRGVKVGGSLGCSNCEIVELRKREQIKKQDDSPGFQESRL